MWFNRRQKKNEDREKKPTVNQGIFYLYLIIILQVFFVFGLMAAVVAVGKVLTTPIWVFLFAFIVGAAGCVYIYRKAKQHLGKVRDAIKEANLGDRNYEISFMGGMVTMKVEHNPSRLIEDHSQDIVDTVETDSVESTPLMPPEVNASSR